MLNYISCTQKFMHRAVQHVFKCPNQTLRDEDTFIQFLYGKILTHISHIHNSNFWPFGDQTIEGLLIRHQEPSVHLESQLLLKGLLILHLIISTTRNLHRTVFVGLWRVHKSLMLCLMICWQQLRTVKGSLFERVFYKCFSWTVGDKCKY